MAESTFAKASVDEGEEGGEGENGRNGEREIVLL
jgi:hypothetical protein